MKGKTEKAGVTPVKNTIYREVTYSSRRLSRSRRVVYAIAVPIARMLIRLMWRSCPIETVVGEHHITSLLEKRATVIPCFWHQHQLMCVRYLLNQRHRGLKPGFLISPSVDGEAPAALVRSIGGHVVRGSATRTGARALREIFLAIKRDHVSPLMLPDGPQGPAFEAKPGALMLSQLTGAPIVPMAFAASRARVLNTWDRFVLPIPFSRIAIAVGEPIDVNRKLGPDELASLQQELAATLKRLFGEAQAALPRSARLSRSRSA